ncbi:AraC family transcriptional regulator [Nostoc ellipsosporum NOK]|nr:AraC family transcriptional regulator [Nostoc ellipsosporum NOK]
MRFDTIIPCARLQPYIRQFVISENEGTSQYKVYPATGLVAGFQYKGRLASISDGQHLPLSTAGITGMSDQYKLFSHNAPVGTLLVYFTETGLAHFTNQPAHELFNLSVTLDNLFTPLQVRETEDQLAAAATDQQRVHIIERFFLSLLKDIDTDKLVLEAIRMIYASKGTIRIKDLHTRLLISQSPFEKRFRRLVGTSPKKFASIVRFNAVLSQLNDQPSMTSLGYDHDFFDQSHFIRYFKQYTGETPESFRRKQ